MKKIFSFGKKKKWGSSPNTSDAGSVLSVVGYELKDKDLSKLHRAASAGDVGKIKQLIKKQDVNQLDKENRTPLHIACANGHLDAVKLLLESKSKLNLCDNDSRSPLLKAIQCQQESCAIALLEHNADPNLVDINGNAALHLAALIPSVSIAKQLLEHGANINAINKEGCTPLILAVTESNEEMVEFLLKEGSDINACDRSGRTSLMISSNNGQNNLVRMLLQHEADINMKDEKGWTADDYGVMNGHHACSHLIIEHGSKKRPTMSPCYESNQRRKTSTFNTPNRTGENGCSSVSPATNKKDSQSQVESGSCVSDKSGDVDSWPSSDEDNDDLDFCPKKTPKPSLTQLLEKKKHDNKKANSEPRSDIVKKRTCKNNISNPSSHENDAVNEDNKLEDKENEVAEKFVNEVEENELEATSGQCEHLDCEEESEQCEEESEQCENEDCEEDSEQCENEDCEENSEECEDEECDEEDSEEGEECDEEDSEHCEGKESEENSEQNEGEEFEDNSEQNEGEEFEENSEQNEGEEFKEDSDQCRDEKFDKFDHDDTSVDCVNGKEVLQQSGNEDCEDVSVRHEERCCKDATPLYYCEDFENHSAQCEKEVCKDDSRQYKEKEHENDPGQCEKKEHNGDPGQCKIRESVNFTQEEDFKTAPTYGKSEDGISSSLKYQENDYENFEQHTGKNNTLIDEHVDPEASASLHHLALDNTSEKTEKKNVPSTSRQNVINKQTFSKMHLKNTSDDNMYTGQPLQDFKNVSDGDGIPVSLITGLYENSDENVTSLTENEITSLANKVETFDKKDEKICPFKGKLDSPFINTLADNKIEKGSNLNLKDDTFMYDAQTQISKIHHGSSNADDENDNSDFEESVERSPIKANMHSLSLSGETYSEEKLQDIEGPAVRKVELMSELGLEDDDIESPWDSESASESSKKQVVSDLPLPAAKTPMQCISEESNEDVFYRPSFIRPSRNIPKQDVCWPGCQSEFSEKSVSMESKKPKLVHGSLQKHVSPSLSVAKESEGTVKPDLMDDLGLDDAEDIEDASDWDSASLSPKYTMPHQRATSQVQNRREETEPRAEAPLPTFSTIIPPVPLQKEVEPDEDGHSTTSEDEFNSTNDAVPELPNCKEDSLKEKVENNTVPVLKTHSLSNVTVRNWTENASHQAGHETVMPNLEDSHESSGLKLSWEEKYEKMWVDNEKTNVKKHFKTITAELKQKFGELSEKRRQRTNKSLTKASKPYNNGLFSASTDHINALSNSEPENYNGAGTECNSKLVHSETPYSVTDGSLANNNLPWDQDREKTSRGLIVAFGTSEKGNFADSLGMKPQDKYIIALQEPKCSNSNLKVENPKGDVLSLAYTENHQKLKDADHLSFIPSNLSKEAVTLVSKVSKIQNPAECVVNQQHSNKHGQVQLSEHASSGVLQTSSVNLDKELEQDVQRFKNEVGILQMAFISLAEEKGQLQKEQADQKGNQQYENSQTQSEQSKQDNRNMFAEEAHTISDQHVDLHPKLGLVRGIKNVMHFGDDKSSNKKFVLDGKLACKQMKNSTNGDPLEVFDDSTLSDTSQEEDGRASGKFTSETNKLDNAGELEDFSPSSDTATEEYGTPTLPFRNAKLLIEQLSFDSQDSVNLLKFQNIIHEYERTIQRENGRYKLLANKVKKMENERKHLQQITEKNRELKSMLDHQKVDWESDLNSLRFTLKQEEEKRKNAEMLYDKIQEQLRRKEDLCCKEMEAKQLLELTVRNLELELRSMQNNVKQVEEERNEVQRLLSHEHNARIAQEDVLNNIRRKSEEAENQKMWTKTAEVLGQLSKIDEREKDLIQQNDNLQEEINVLKLEINHVRSQNQQEESKFMDENENLKEKIADLRRDLKMNEETLTQTVIQYNSQLHALKTENTMLCSKLEHEKQGKDRLETELESIRSRLTSTLQEVERNQALKIDVERTLQRDRDEWLRSQDKLNHELSNIRENNNNLSQQLSRAEAKSNSLENEIRQANMSLQDKLILSENTQRELTQACGRIKELEHTLQLEKDKLCKSTVKQESLQEKLAQIQSENMLLRQQIEDVNNKGIIKDKTVSDVQDKFTEIIGKLRADAERQVQIIEERNKDLIVKYNEIREQMCRLETEKVERESSLRQLQQELADALKKLSMSEASLDVITHYRNDIEGEKQLLQKEVEKFKIKVHNLEEQCIQAERLQNQLKNLLEDKERDIMASSQKLQEYSSAVAGAENTIKELEGHILKLEIENAKIEATAKQQAGQIDILQKELRETLSIRHKLEELVVSLQSSKMGLEEKLNHQDSHNLWEEELKSRSRLGIRLAELEQEKAKFTDQVESEKKKVKKLMEHKRSMEARFDQEMKRNTDLQKEIAGLKKLLKMAKKKIKELESGGFQHSSQDGFKSTHFEKESDIMKLKEKIHELSFRLENESSNYKQLESANRDLQRQLSSLKIFHKSQEHLEKGKRQLEDEVTNLKRQIEINKVDQSLIEKHKREIEERGRQELRQKLEEVNLFLQSQATSQETLDQIRAANDSSVRNQMEHRIQELESELHKIKHIQHESMLQKESTQTELDRFKELYNEELKNRNSLAVKLERANERLADANAKLLTERQRTKSLIASSFMNGSLATSPVADASPFGNLSNSGFRLGGSFLSSTANGINTNRVESYVNKMQQELEKNITKELDQANIELETGSSVRVSPVGSIAGSLRKVNVDQDPVSRATQQYLEVLKKNYKI
ncbi:ankyrin repeat domain-containing protein 26 isoform X2 [Xenopus laevis]|uniref:Ankyrin repeat domain-containing protein 26 isoform X2 n=1 Tax=Xenopus laevis TaxID=8355 RepID=A0A8J1MRT0_XENLA|nr:ankyrin repeat domain-containing protein 26 isoform X2 [Xenopus laevis]